MLVLVCSILVLSNNIEGNKDESEWMIVSNKPEIHSIVVSSYGSLDFWLLQWNTHTYTQTLSKCTQTLHCNNLLSLSQNVAFYSLRTYWHFSLSRAMNVTEFNIHPKSWSHTVSLILLLPCHSFSVKIN